MRYLTGFKTRATPQSQPIPGAGQVRNSAGGYAWAVDDWTRLDRFLVLGSEGGSYYATEQKLTAENAEAVLRCVESDGLRAVARIVEISESGRAPKNDPAIFALALAAAQGDLATRQAAFDALPRVCRIGTHLFHFAAYVEGFRGWGRGLRRAVGHWYNGQPAERVAFQAVKYQQRDGWSHRDLLRLAHPVPATEAHGQVYKWVVDGELPADGAAEDLRLIQAFVAAQTAGTKGEIVRLIRDERLPREAIPTQWLTEAEVWEALLEDMPMTAVIRNLATMTRVGLLAPMSAGTKRVVAQLGDETRLRKARVHPIAVLSALRTYAEGRGMRGKQTWTPVQPIADALDAAFYASFGNVTPTGERWLLAVDVSGSMDAGVIAGVPGLRPRHAAAAMTLVTAAVEPEHEIVGFTSAAPGVSGKRSFSLDSSEYGWSRALTPLQISPRKRLDDVIGYMQSLPFGGTDCALPMLYATERRLEVDAFVIYTDSETWAGGIHPVQALQAYREKLGIAAKLIVVGMVSNGFTIADPEDGGMLDVVGFDTATPELISAFAADKLGVERHDAAVA